MKKTVLVLILSLILVFFSGCQYIIKIDIDEAGSSDSSSEDIGDNSTSEDSSDNSSDTSSESSDESSSDSSTDNTSSDNVSSDESSDSPSEDVEIVVWDSGKCGENLNWELLSDGTLHIFGTGEMYDYVKYYTPAPWYKYRNEPYISEDGQSILDPDGTEYAMVSDYNKSNPKGYKYNKVVIDPGVTHIGNWAFYRVCVDELSIPEGVTKLGYFSVRYSPTLKVLNLPDSLLLIDDYGVSRNHVLKTVNVGNSLETIGLAGFNMNPNLESVILPESVKSINIRLHEIHKGLGSLNGSASSESDNVGVFENCSSLKYVSLGKISYIPQRTFSNCSKLEAIIIPNTAEYIEEYAFNGCSSLKEVVFQSGSQCKIIKTKAFLNAINIESFTGCTALETVENNAFVKDNLKSLKIFEFSDSNVSFQGSMFSNSQLTTAKIGNNMISISNHMFCRSTIKEIYISNSVTNFKEGCLRECGSLTDIYYDGTRAEWDTITKEKNWCFGASNWSYSATVHFSDGTTEILKNIK